MDTYHVYCLHSENLPEYYTGFTKAWVKRWDMHKCKAKVSSIIVYKYIRENGGIDNFKMECLETIYGTEDEARQRERYWFDVIKPTLNSQTPTRNAKDSQKNYRSTDAGIEKERKSREAYNSSEHGKAKNRAYKKTYNNKMYECECGSTVTFNHRCEHFKSNFHKNYINSK